MDALFTFLIVVGCILLILFLVVVGIVIWVLIKLFKTIFAEFNAGKDRAKP